MPEQQFQYDIIGVKPKLLGKSKFEYAEIIHQKAAEGWRLVTAIVPPEGFVSSSSIYLDLVFERPIKDG